MKRVVITGMGINSCIGNTLEEVTHALQNGISGTRFNPTYAELNFKSHISAAAEQDFDGIDRKLKRFMGVCAMYAYMAQTPIKRFSLRSIPSKSCSAAALIWLLKLSSA